MNTNAKGKALPCETALLHYLHSVIILFRCISLHPFLLKSHSLPSERQMSPGWLFGAITPLYRTEALSQPSHPGWFTEICGEFMHAQKSAHVDIICETGVCFYDMRLRERYFATHTEISDFSLFPVAISFLFPNQTSWKHGLRSQGGEGEPSVLPVND